jgi:hypothetical protein
LELLEHLEVRGGRSAAGSGKTLVIAAVHTLTIESFWSIFKHGIVGTFYKVSDKYLAPHVAGDKAFLTLY